MPSCRLCFCRLIAVQEEDPGNGQDAAKRLKMDPLMGMSSRSCCLHPCLTSLSITMSNKRQHWRDLPNLIMIITDHWHKITKRWIQPSNGYQTCKEDFAQSAPVSTWSSNKNSSLAIIKDRPGICQMSSLSLEGGVKSIVEFGQDMKGAQSHPE